MTAAAAFTWTTRDGRRLRVVDMDDNHLLNTVRWMRRHPRTRMFCLLWAFRAARYAESAPDGESMAAESAASEFMDMALGARLAPDDVVTEAFPVFPHMVAELDRRAVPK